MARRCRSPSTRRSCPSWARCFRCCGYRTAKRSIFLALRDARTRVERAIARKKPARMCKTASFCTCSGRCSTHRTRPERSPQAKDRLQERACVCGNASFLSGAPSPSSRRFDRAVTHLIEQSRRWSRGHDVARSRARITYERRTMCRALSPAQMSCHGDRPTVATQNGRPVVLGSLPLYGEREEHE